MVHPQMEKSMLASLARTLLLVSTLLTACGGNILGPENAMKAYHQAWCEALESCGYLSEYCMTLGYDCQGMPRSYVEFVPEFDSAQLNACISALEQSESCDLALFQPIVPDACARVFTNAARLGEPCSDRPCGEGACTWTWGWDNCPTCESHDIESEIDSLWAVEGEACNDSIHCYPVFSCIDGVCTQHPDLGEPCSATYECLYGAVCDGGTCVRLEQCVAGAPCIWDGQCPTGSRCRHDVCVPEVSQGNSCELFAGEDDICAEGLYCDDVLSGICRPRAALGEPCDVIDSNPCLEGFCKGNLDSATCAPLIPNGEPCEWGAHWTCESSLCDNDTLTCVDTCAKKLGPQ